MLLAAAFICFAGQVVAWLVLPSSAEKARVEPYAEMSMDMDTGEAAA